MKKLIQQRNHIAPSSNEHQQKVPLFSRSRIKKVSKEAETNTLLYHFDAAQEASQFLVSADHNHPIVPKIQPSSKTLTKDKQLKDKPLKETTKRKQQNVKNLKQKKKQKTTDTSDDEGDAISIGEDDSEDEKHDDTYSDLDDFVVSECEDDLILND